MHAANRRGQQAMEPLAELFLPACSKGGNEPLEFAFRRVCAQLLPRFGFFPVRAVVVARFASVAERRLCNEVLLKSGARSVLFLEPVVAATIGIDGADKQPVPPRSGCLLCWSRGLDLVGAEGRRPVFAVSLNAETFHQQAGGVSAQTAADVLPYSAHGLEGLRIALERLKAEGFLAGGLRVLRISGEQPELAQWLDKSGIAVQRVEEGTMLVGALTVLNALRSWRFRLRA